MHRQISKHLVRPRAILRPATCALCGTRFFASRTSAVFCSSRCRQRSFQAKLNPKAEDRSAKIGRVLRKLGFIGQVAPTYHLDPTPATFALMIPRGIAAAEISVFWTVSPVSAAEVAEALKKQGILDFKEPVPESANAKVRPRLPRIGFRNANLAKISTKSAAAKRRKGPKNEVEQHPAGRV